VAWRARTPLAEALEVVEGNVVAGEEQQAIDERRGVTVGEDEPVAVGPLGMRGIVVHDGVKQGIADGRAAHGRSGMAALGFLYRVKGEQTQRVDGEFVERRLVEGLVREGGSHDIWSDFLSWCCPILMCLMHLGNMLLTTAAQASIFTTTLYPSQLSGSTQWRVHSIWPVELPGGISALNPALVRLRL